MDDNQDKLIAAIKAHAEDAEFKLLGYYVGKPQGGGLWSHYSKGRFDRTKGAELFDHEGDAQTAVESHAGSFYYPVYEKPSGTLYPTIPEIALIFRDQVG